jgi:hypothetical protein
MLAGILVTALGAGLAACGPIGVPGSVLVEPGGAFESGLDGLVRFNVPAGGGRGDIRVSFGVEPLPDDRPVPPGIVTVGDMVTLDLRGDVTKARIAIDYAELPAGVRPEMLNVFGWSADLGGWVPLTASVTDAVDRTVAGDTVLFDSFVLGTWRLTTDAAGDAITTDNGVVLPVKAGTDRTFWAYARAAAASSLTDAVEHLSGPPEALVCTPRAAPAGRFDACVLAGTGSQRVVVRNRLPFPMLLRLPADGRVRPVVDTQATADTPDALDGIRDTLLTYLTGAVAVGGGQTVTLELQPGARGPVQLTGRLDWSVVALDTGLRQLDLLLPNSRALRPRTAEALLLAHPEHGATARDALAAGDVDAPAVQNLLRAAGVADSGRSIADLFQFGSCVLDRTDTAAGASQDVLAALRTAGPTVISFTTDCLNTIYEKYLPEDSRSAKAVLDTLKGATGAIRNVVPKNDRKRGTGQVTVTLTPR